METSSNYNLVGVFGSKPTEKSELLLYVSWRKHAGSHYRPIVEQIARYNFRHRGWVEATINYQRRMNWRNLDNGTYNVPPLQGSGCPEAQQSIWWWPDHGHTHCSTSHWEFDRLRTRFVADKTTRLLSSITICERHDWITQTFMTLWNLPSRVRDQNRRFIGEGVAFVYQSPGMWWHGKMQKKTAGKWCGPTKIDNQKCM